MVEHLSHAVPLYQKLGGTLVVTTASAYDEVTRQGLKVILIDTVNISRQAFFDKFRARLGVRLSSLHLGRHLRNTFHYLDSNADVVLFYDLYEFSRHTRLSKAQTIFMTHGNMLKDYYSMYPRRLSIVEQYDYVAALGPYLRDKCLALGMSEQKLLSIGTARNDLIVSEGVSTKKSHIPMSFCYVPTYWSASSVHYLGTKLVEYFPSKYRLFVRLHPQTPVYIKDKYTALIRSRDDEAVIMADDTAVEDLLSRSDAIIGDLSSVMLDAILTRKPLLFIDSDSPSDDIASYSPINEVYTRSPRMSLGTKEEVNHLLETTLTADIDKNAWDTVIRRCFYDYNGTAIDHIIATIDEIVRK